MVGKYLGLEVGIGLRNPFVLAQVLRPGLDHEPFDHLLRIGRNLGQAAAIGAIAPARGEQAHAGSGLFFRRCFAEN